MHSVSATRELILASACPLPPEHIPLASALNRILRENACADTDMPPFDCSAMDGYALASTDQSESFKVVGELQAGSAEEIPFGPGECIRIFTGARLPEGADRVVMQEDAQVESNVMRITSTSFGSNIRKRGENCRRGEIIVPEGRQLQPHDLASLASCGITHPKVTRKVRVAHFVSGDELVEPGQTPRGAQIRDSNSTLIAALLEQHGAELIHHARLPDSLEASLAATTVLDAKDYDLLLISGGASVGDYDFTRPLMERLGFTIHLQKVNLRPGKPLVYGTRGQTAAFGLPGNPVSHWVIFHLFLAPLLAALSGASRPPVSLMRGYLDRDLQAKANPRETWWPCSVTWREEAFRVTPLRFQSSGDITGVSGANALLRIPPESSPIAEHEPVDFLLLRDLI